MLLKSLLSLCVRGLMGLCILGKAQGGMQLKDDWCPYAFEQHCLAHKLNLAYKILSRMGIFSDSKEEL